MEKRIDVGGDAHLIIDGNNDRKSVYITVFWYGVATDAQFTAMIDDITELMKNKLAEVIAS